MIGLCRKYFADSMFIVGILLSAGICGKFSSYKITSVFACGVISSMLSSGPLCSLLPLWSVRLMIVNDGFEEKKEGQGHMLNSYSNNVAGFLFDINKRSDKKKTPLRPFLLSSCFIAA